MNRFKGRVALVTGGRSGIGCAIAKRLQSGSATVITVQRQPDNDHECIVAGLEDPNVPESCGLFP